MDSRPQGDNLEDIPQEGSPAATRQVVASSEASQVVTPQVGDSSEVSRAASLVATGPLPMAGQATVLRHNRATRNKITRAVQITLTAASSRLHPEHTDNL